MRIITLMNYNKEPHITMCKAWFYFTRKYNPNAEIIVYFKDNISKELLRDDVTYKKVDTLNVPSINYRDNCKLSIHKEWKKYNRFIFLDADAIPFDSLNELYDNVRKPVTFCGHEKTEGYGIYHLNSGVFVQKEQFFDYKDLKNIYDNSYGALNYPGTDQCLTQMYFDSIGYVPFDYDIMGHEYNSCGNVNVKIENDNINIISNITNKKVKILHTYDKWSLWQNKNTRELWKWMSNLPRDKSRGF